MKHYSKEELDCYRHRKMSILKRIQCASHLKECQECAQLLAELEQDEAFVTELRNGLKQYRQAALSQEETPETEEKPSSPGR